MKKKGIYWTVKNHRRLWRWLALHPRCGKAAWPGWQTEDMPYVVNCCFTCSYVQNNGFRNKYTCNYFYIRTLSDIRDGAACLLKWTKRASDSCMFISREHVSPYKQWTTPVDTNLMSENAFLVAGLPLSKWNYTQFSS